MMAVSRKKSISFDLTMSNNYWEKAEKEADVRGYGKWELIEIKIYSQLKKLDLLSKSNLLSDSSLKIYNEIMDYSKDQIYIDEVNNLSPFALGSLNFLAKKSLFFAGDLKQKTQQARLFAVKSLDQLEWAFGSFERVTLEKSYRLTEKLAYFAFDVMRGTFLADPKTLSKFEKLEGSKPIYFDLIGEYSKIRRVHDSSPTFLAILKSWVQNSSVFPSILIIHDDISSPAITLLKVEVKKFINDLLFFTTAEKYDFLKHQKFLDDLSSGILKPTTEAQVHFIRVCQGIDYPKLPFEKIYMKYKACNTDPIRFKNFSEIEGQQSECAIVIDPQSIKNKKTLNLVLTRASKHLGFIFTAPDAWASERFYLERYDDDSFHASSI